MSYFKSSAPRAPYKSPLAGSEIVFGPKSVYKTRRMFLARKANHGHYGRPNCHGLLLPSVGLATSYRLMGGFSEYV